MDLNKGTVILDRDGTLIDVVRDAETGSVSVAFHPSHIRFLPGVIGGLLRLQQAGYSLSVATNQPGAAKGQIPLKAITETNAALIRSLAEFGINGVDLRACIHHPVGGPGGDDSLVGPCDCRKPAAGLLERTLEHQETSATRSWMVGDSVGDVLAGANAGVRTILLLPGDRCELCPHRDSLAGVSPTFTAAGFGDAVDKIIATDQRQSRMLGESPKCVCRS